MRKPADIISEFHRMDMPCNITWNTVQELMKECADEAIDEYRDRLLESEPNSAKRMKLELTASEVKSQME